MKIGPVFSLAEFMERLNKIVSENEIASIGVVLTSKDTTYSYQFGMDDDDMRIAAKLFKEYIKQTETEH